MQVISLSDLFSRRKFGYIFIVTAIIFMLTGCTRDEPKPRYKYMVRNCPKITILHPIDKKYQVRDYKLNFKDLDRGHYTVKKEDLKKASKTSQRKSVLIKKQQKYIKFYEKQCRALKRQCNRKIKFNKGK